MSKTLRNTLFTALLLGLTGLGVSWNEEIARERTPIAIGETVLAEFSGQEQSTGNMKLEVELSRAAVLLGQYQVVTIETLPFADLDLALQKADGQFVVEQTLRSTADELGRYQWRFRVNDFGSVGPLQALVRASLGDKSAARRSSFVVQTWNEAKQREEFLHPIVP